jgi:gas vesicle protein
MDNNVDLNNKRNRERLNHNRSQEGFVVIGAITFVITALIVANGIAKQADKVKINKILRVMEPYIDKIKSELSELYNECKSVIDFLKKSKYIDNISSHYKSDISNIKEDDNINITEDKFIKIFMEKIGREVMYQKKAIEKQ